jgi:uncharacterized membrane protein YebE (DUF533 family)
VAGLGYFAYKKWQAGRASAPAHPPSGAAAGHSPVDPVPAELPGPAITENLAAAMVRAMIAAALADGELDASQMEAVEAALDNPALTEEEKRELTLCLHRPPTVDAIAALVDNEEEASEVYGACLAVVNPGNLAESLFLRRLGKALRLSPELVEALHGSAQSQFEQA